MKSFSEVNPNDPLNLATLSPTEREEVLMDLLAKDHTQETYTLLKEHFPDLPTWEEAQEVVDYAHFFDVNDITLDELVRQLQFGSPGYIQCVGLGGRVKDITEGVLYYGAKEITTEKLRLAWNMIMGGSDAFMMIAPGNEE